jgi:CBS domain-containing protein/sporulation protein YlmC with PRC-barrel domain
MNATPSSVPPAHAEDTTMFHLSELLKRPVVDRHGQPLGRLADVIVRLRGTEYPLVTGLVVTVGPRRVFVPIDQVASFAQEAVTLTSARLDLRPFERRSGEVLLRGDVLGHRLIDVADAHLVRAWDVELALREGDWLVSCLDTHQPRRVLGLFGRKSSGHACRDWKAFEPLIGHTHSALSRGAGRLRGLKPAQIADLLEDARKEEETELLGRVHEDPELEADVFEELEEDLASRLLGARTNAKIAEVLARMRADDAADAIAELPQRRREPVLDLLPPGQRVKVRTLMGFNPTSAGGLMGLDFLALDPHTTAADALAAVARATNLQSEALTSVYLLDGDGHLHGVARLVALVQAAPTAQLIDIADMDPVRIAAQSDAVDVAVLMADYNLFTLPVVDDDGRMLGVITVDDVLEATLPEDWRRREPPDTRHGGERHSADSPTQDSTGQASPPTPGRETP